MENNESLTPKILHSDALEAINRAEIDIQINTAKQFPRDLNKVLNKISTLATMDTETAEECHYALRRGYGSDSKVIEGLSVRFAEIVANCWGNIRVQTNIIANDGKTVTARGVCHDLENNVAVSVEVKRRITDKNGKTFTEDMQVVTGNAASSIAFRNAVFKVIPKAITKKIVQDIKDVAIGKALDVDTAKQNALTNFAKIGVTEKMICEFLEIKNISEIDKEMIYTLKGAWNAIKNNETTVKDLFVKKGVEKTDLDLAKEQIIAGLELYQGTDKKIIQAECVKANSEGSFNMEFAQMISKKINIDLV